MHSIMFVSLYLVDKKIGMLGELGHSSNCHIRVRIPACKFLTSESDRQGAETSKLFLFLKVAFSAFSYFGKAITAIQGTGKDFTGLRL